MHVDGFRFDLAAALGRGEQAFDRRSAFFAVVHQDPILRTVKLIAEPWDVGNDGYQLGQFPAAWSEWNDRFRDSVRDFWRSKPEVVGDFATRVLGSSDLYQHVGRSARSSINFVTAHDGFTLRDLVSYNEKHNEANGEDNRDGTDDNRSWNLGAEGPTGDEDVNARRARQVRNFLTTLLVARGVPMMLAGDEFGRTQQGNNNAYCQDNALTWIDWEHADRDLAEFTRRAIALRRDQPVFCTTEWTPDSPGPNPPAVTFLTADGQSMDESWSSGTSSLMVVLDQDGRDGQPCGSVGLLFNAALEDVTFTLPVLSSSRGWLVMLDSAIPTGIGEAREVHDGAATITRPSLSVLVLCSLGVEHESRG
jgi:glycogen operon protein